MKPTVIVGYDHTPSSERALAEAGREAAWRGASVTVVHAFRRDPDVMPKAGTPLRVEESVKDAAIEIASLGADFLHYRHPGMEVQAKAIADAPFEVLTAAAQDADLLVVGNRGCGGSAGLPLGSTSMQTVAHAPCPVMVVRGDAHDRHDAIVAAIDIEDPADELLDFAFAEASHRSAELRAISVWDVSWAAVYAGDTAEIHRASQQAIADAETTLENLLQPWQAKYPDVRVHGEAADGTPSAILTGATSYADLIIAGAHRNGDGHDGLRIGPIAHTLLRHAACPVVIVPRD